MKPGTHRETRRQRQRARRRVLQAMYQWQLTGQDPREIEQQFLTECRLGRTDLEYFSALVHGIPAACSTIDALIEPCLDRPFVTLDPVERALLRIGVYELTERLDVPYRVVINEAVELAKRFGAEQSHRYINGVLDRIGRADRFRTAELKRNGGPGRR